MSAVALILNLLLGGLLVAALGMGWRLERRLTALRDSQASFVGAVQDLDRAAARAEQGLADLRAATDEAAESLASRIATAKTLSAKLDTSISRAAAMPEPARARPEGRGEVRPEVRPETRPETRPDLRQELRADSRFEARPGARFERRAEQLAERLAARDIRDDLILEEEPVAERRPFEARLEGLRARLAAAPPPAPAYQPDPSRSRARVDDDLFDEVAARRAARDDLGLGASRR